MSTLASEHHHSHRTGGGHPFTIVEASPDERAAGALTSERLAAVAASLREHGAAVIRGAVDLERCDLLLEAMMAELDQAAAKPHALDSKGHLQHNPPPRAEHLHVDIFANPVAVSVARALLGQGIQLSLYTGNTMLGHTAEAQPVHWDEFQLWAGLSQAPPAASLTVNIPLVDVTVENGALELWPGTHHDARSGDHVGEGLLVPEDWLDTRRADVPPVRVPLPRGALFLRDGRVWHRGTTNTTAHPRPMVAMLYTAWWFRPYVIDFYPDAEPMLRASGIGVTARYREAFDHHLWPPNWNLVPQPVD
jgi:ectoine hydroxylase-related dioxygenase (phytanoyl-CoA dioxygenase family)